MRRSHFTAVVCPTGRVKWLCERAAILVILMALIMMSARGGSQLSGLPWPGLSS